MWQETVKPFVDSGELVVVGVVQEQHPQRARLYAQWRQLDWPIFVDSLNLLLIDVVPVPVAIDERGVVRHESIRPRQLVKKFLEIDYPPADSTPPAIAPRPKIDQLRADAKRTQTAEAWRELGDAFFLEGGKDTLTGAVEAYEQAIAADSTDARAHFRLGVVLRNRYESAASQEGDGQRAVEQWGFALSLNPNQYIWRRRIQQYGPRLDKPYNFYFWVDEARKEIKARGETPVRLAVEPAGSELAPPAKGRGADGDRSAASVATSAPSCRETNESLHRDDRSYVAIESIVTPARVRPGQRVRVRVGFQLNPKTRPYWNNEARELAICLEVPPGLSLGEGSLVFPNPSKAETQEDRAVEFEVTIADEAQPGVISMPAYALYYVCENKGGKCRYLRQDFRVPIEVDRKAPTLR
ncbi:MAG: hypothetical protein IIB57_14805 [Planctomycetes bacterium]|nr:hypothetical protein [Planctomycetota bacterium]